MRVVYTRSLYITALNERASYKGALYAGPGSVLMTFRGSPRGADLGDDELLLLDEAQGVRHLLLPEGEQELVDARACAP